MAKKLDLDINTDSFLESIRPEMPPSSTQKKEADYDFRFLQVLSHHLK